MPIARQCHTCHATFQVSPSALLHSASHYCSLPCYHRAMVRHPSQVCVVCHEPFLTHTHIRRWYCSKQCRNSPAAMAHRLWMKILSCSHGSHCPYCCWEWQGALNKDGYGIVTLHRPRSTSTTRQAHRLAWETHHKRPIADGLVCAHYCHNPRCCNPWHLHCGTFHENMADSVRDQRMTRGERMHNSRLRPEDIHTIFLQAASGETASAIARELLVQKITILRVLHRRTWKHIPIPEALMTAASTFLDTRRRPEGVLP